MEGLHYLNYILQSKLDMKDAYFSVPLYKIPGKRFSIVREALWISVPMFWSRPSTSHFHKAFESPNVTIKEIEHTDYKFT